MTEPGTQAPLAFGRLLHSKWLFMGARLLLVGAYLEGGAAKLADWPAALAEQAGLGLRPAAFWAALTVAVELGGSTLVLADRWTWLGAGMLGVFTALAAIIADHFWTMEGAARFAATNAFFEHFGLVGGFALIALASSQRRGAGGR